MLAALALSMSRGPERQSVKRPGNGTRAIVIVSAAKVRQFYRSDYLSTLSFPNTVKTFNARLFSTIEIL
jgi:hypothetical protein